MLETVGPSAAPKSSPWGPVQHAEKVGSRGLWSVGTAGHGGIFVPPALNAQIHPAWRQSNGWYEEDCEWAIVAFTFPDDFPAAAAAEAPRVVKDWSPDGYTAATGEAIPLAESYVLRAREAKQRTTGQYVARAAWGAAPGTGVTEGWVGVFAFRSSDAAEGYFLVPADEYEARDQHGFVVDPARHAPWTGHPHA